MIYSGRNTYLFMVGLQYLAQCLIGRKCLIINAWLLFQPGIQPFCTKGIKNSKPDTCCIPVMEFSVLNKDKGKIMMNQIFKSFSKSQDRPLPLCLHLPFQHCHSLQILPQCYNFHLHSFTISYCSDCLLFNDIWENLTFISKTPSNYRQDEWFLSFPAGR